MTDDDFKEALSVASLLEQSRGAALGPASSGERIVFGSRMPGYGARSIPRTVVFKWISDMEAAGIKRVCCLLGKDQLGYYEADLLEAYREGFGPKNVIWVPIADYCLCHASNLHKILLFLRESDAATLPTVVHCAGGRGRTGLVLAAWLIAGRGFELQKALDSARAMGRNPLEAVQAGNTTIDDLYRLLHSCREVSYTD